MSKEKESKSFNIGDGVQYHKNPNPNNLPISQKVRESLQTNPCDDVVTINHYTPFCMERVAVRIAFENMPPHKAEVLLKLFEDTVKESQILNRIKEGELKQSEANEFIRECRIKNATEEMVKWKAARNREQSLPLEQRAGRMFKRFCQRLKKDPLEHSMLANIKGRRLEFFNGIERTLRGEKVF